MPLWTSMSLCFYCCLLSPPPLPIVATTTACLQKPASSLPLPLVHHFCLLSSATSFPPHLQPPSSDQPHSLLLQLSWLLHDINRQSLSPSTLPFSLRKSSILPHPKATPLQLWELAWWRGRQCLSVGIALESIPLWMMMLRWPDHFFFSYLNLLNPWLSYYETSNIYQELLLARSTC